MNPLLIYGAANVGASLLGGILGGGSGDLDRLIELVEKEYAKSNYSGFLPDKSAFDRSLRAQMSELLSQLPVSTEAFGADLASRGIHGAGEAPGYYQADVVAPVMRAGATAIGESELGYAKAYQYGSIMGEQMRMANLDRLIALTLGKQQSKADFWGGIGGAAGKTFDWLAMKDIFGSEG